MEQEIKSDKYQPKVPPDSFWIVQDYQEAQVPFHHQ